MKKTFVLTTILLLLAVLPSKAQDFGFSAGGTFSPKACGLSLAWGRADGFYEVRLSADLNNVLGGDSSRPGVRADWFYDFIISRWQAKEGLAIYLYSGPGAMIGYVDDYEKGRGVAASVSANIGFLFKFSGNISINAGFSGNMGFHLTMTDSHHSKMTFYKAGAFGTVFPEIGIRYCF